MPRVIINADDFGLSPGVSRGILECFRRGVLTSTTMLVNLEGFDDGVALAHENADLPVGVHLSLLWGPPVSPAEQVPTLVEADGQFPRSFTVLARRYYTGRLSLEEVRLEFAAQIRRFQAAGLRPTHVDTHKHVHCLHGVLRGLIGAAGDTGVRRLRLPAEEPPGRGAPPRTLKARARRRLIHWLCRDHRETIDAAGLATTERFAGIELSDRFDAAALGFLIGSAGVARDAVTEIMCHPGYSDEGMRRWARIPPLREVELEGLCAPEVRRRVEDAGVELIHYGQL